MKYLIVGLGNIGKQYTYTRHNVGFRILDTLVAQHDQSFKLKKLARTACISHKGRYLWLVKPTTYMNLSGQAVQYWKQKLDIPNERLLIITDDIHLPLGKLRLREKGSSGGHNGLANIEEVLKTNQYPRLRFGIGDEFLPGEQAEFVLMEPSYEEKVIYENTIKVASNAVLDYCTQPTQITMNQYNNPTIQTNLSKY